MGSSCEDLIAEAEAAPIDGWDFSWLEGRATEERPPWGYSRLIGERTRTARRVLDLQSGGGELLAALPHVPPLLVAAEGYLPNVPLAARRLGPRGACVVAADNDQPGLPFASGSFDLVTSRHPVQTWYEEVFRVLQPGGTFLSQQVGAHSMRELSEFMMGPLPAGSTRRPEDAAAQARAAGFVVQDLREARLQAAFYDIGAVVFFLRLVVWTVPGFSVERYADRLRALHERIEREGRFVAHATRFLIEAHKPG